MLDGCDNLLGMIADENIQVSDALARFYRAEKLGQDAFINPVNYAQLGPLKLPFPNLSARRSLVYLHDINHLMTGYDTSWIGEGEVAVWELASGFPKHCWVGYLYAPFALLPGLLLNPARVFRAFKKGRREKNSCHFESGKEQILRMKLNELKRSLGVD